MGYPKHPSRRGLIESGALERAVDAAVEKGGDPEVLRAVQNIIRSGTHCTRNAAKVILSMIERSLGK